MSISAKVIQVIRATVTRGRGTEDDPHRTTYEYFDLDGNFLADMNASKLEQREKLKE